MRLNVEALRSFLAKLKPRRAIIFCHHNADPDALFSARLLAKLLRRLRPGIRCEILAVEGPSALSKLLLEKVPVRLAESPSLEKADLLVLADTSTVEQLGAWKLRVEASGKPLLLLDHHAIHPQTKRLASLLLVDSKACSACEVVYHLCKQAGVKISRRDALGLMFGIIHETRGLRYASPQTFQVLAELASLGVKPEEAFRALAEPPSRSEKIARIKAAGRAETYELGGWLVAVSHVSSFQASAARALLSLGYDLAIVGGEVEGEVRVSLRSTPQFQEETGIHLGRDVAMKVGSLFGGMGGGHASSAGINCGGRLEEVLAECLKIVKEKLNISG
ncbi:MAG: hypothetical protein DRO52_00535 [Candidatus Hecatellales archaeon]|nr:MAG: hypothetical protein DRO52_00535 [Candidatus Hecatellales archaeon]